MIKTHKENVLTAVDVIEDIICNCCGNKINVVNKPKSGYEASDEYLNVYQIWGYESNMDDQHHSFQICEDCYKTWISSFVVPPHID